MALAAAASTVGLTAPLTASQRPFILWIEGVDRIANCDITTIEIDNQDHQSPAIMRFALDDKTNAFATGLASQNFVQFYDSVADLFLFQGWIKSIRPTLHGPYARWEIEATDLSEALDFGYIALDNRPIESDQARIMELLGYSTHFSPLTQGGHISLLSAALPTASHAKETPRTALERVLDATVAGADYHVDQNNGALWTYATTSGVAAPYVVTDAAVPSGGQCPGAISAETDGTPDVDFIYVNGATPIGSGLFPSGGVPRNPPRIAQIDAPDCYDAVTAAAHAAVEAAARTPTLRATITVEGYDGWQRGQTLTVNSTVLGWVSKQLVIKGVMMRVKSGTGIREYTITCGAEIRTLTGQISRLANLAQGPKQGQKLKGSLPTGTTGAPPVSTAYAAVQLTQAGIEVSDANSHRRVTLGNIPGGDWGLQVWSADGSTVIIDGTSDMFRISTTGTLSLTTADGTDNNNTLDISALGTQTTTPTALFWTADSTGVAAGQHSAIFAAYARYFAATSSGGAVTQKFTAMTYWANPIVRLTNDANNYVRIVLNGNNNSGASVTFTMRYYVLAQTAI